MNGNNHRDAKVAYFSSEFGIHKGIPVGGGLGVLAGDALKSACDLGYPVVGVTLLYVRGNFHQQLVDEERDGRKVVSQREYYEPFYVTNLFQRHSKTATVPIQGRQVRVGAWELPIQSSMPGAQSTVSLLYLTPDDHNPTSPHDERICDVLYPSDRYLKLAQEAILGIGGVRMLEQLGYKIEKYHLNEGHAALAAFPLIEKLGEVEAIKRIVFTTHTPVPAGIDHFNKAEADNVLPELMKRYGGRIWGITGNTEGLHMMKLAMAISSNSFGVSDLHAQVSRDMFKDYPNMGRLHSVDNGVHVPSWTSAEVQQLYDKYLGKSWVTEPRVIEHVNRVPLDEILAVHDGPRMRLGQFLRDNPRGRVKGDCTYDPSKLTIGFARRFAHYKQATLAFDKMERLAKLGGHLQFVYSGKSHPDDGGGKGVLADLFNRMDELKKMGVSVWFIEDYDMDVAQLMVQGVDVWLNTPERYREASGTSGMKAAANFVPHLSIIDGWWVNKDAPTGYTYPKGLVQGVTGWGIGKRPDPSEFWILGNNEDAKKVRERFREEDGESLIRTLEDVILPLWQQPGKKDWAKVMRASSAYNASYFNSTRMMKELFERVYGLS